MNMSDLAIPLTQGRSALVSPEDYDVLSSRKWNATRRGSLWYAASGAPIIYMHRLVMGLKRGAPVWVDHINGDGLDNRRENLRLATPSQNGINRRVFTSSTGFRGVWVHKGKFGARVRFEGVDHYLGFFEHAVEAAFAVNQKLDEICLGIGVRNEIDFPLLLSIHEGRGARLAEQIDAVRRATT